MTAEAKPFEKNNCFGCKWLIQDVFCMHCNHKDRIIFQKLEKPCEYCGRKIHSKKGGCGACIGRGEYAHPNIYDQCDCGGYEEDKTVNPNLN